MEGSFERSLCNRCGQVRPPSAAFDRPQNRYLSHLVDELEKCSQSSTDLSKLQKDFVTTKRDMGEVQRELKDLKSERTLQSEKVTALQKDLAEQKLLHLQLREEVSNEFRTLYRKQGTRDKDVEHLKYQTRMNAKKFAFDLDNLKWEVSGNGGKRERSTQEMKFQGISEGPGDGAGSSNDRGNGAGRFESL